MATPRVSRRVIRTCVCVLILLIVLPCTAPFQTCTLADLLGSDAPVHHVGTHHAIPSPMLRVGARRLGEELLTFLGPAADAAEAVVPLPLADAKRLKPTVVASLFPRRDTDQPAYAASVPQPISGHATRLAVLRI